MFGGCVQKFKHRPPGGDVVPNAVDWQTVFWYSNNTAFPPIPPSSTFDYQQITGISSSITLKVNINIVTGTTITLWYKVVNSTSTFSGLPSNNGFTQANDGTTFSVSNNQYVYFSAEADVAEESAEISVKNNSDGDTLLDSSEATFSFYIVSADSPF